MHHGRLQLRRATLSVCVSILMVAVPRICSGQTAPAGMPATNKPVPKTTLPPPKVGGNTSPTGMAAKATAKAGEAGPPNTAMPKTPSGAGGRTQAAPAGRPLPLNKVSPHTPLPPATVVHNPAPLAKSGAVSMGGPGAAPRPSKTTVASESSAAAGRRDPFKAWVAPGSAGRSAPELGPLPAGTRGLLISGLRLEGIVRQQPADEIIAVVTNYTKRAYFLRVNDAVYNGVVNKITPEAIYFKESTLDSRGRVTARDVEIKLGSAPGEGR